MEANRLERPCPWAGELEARLERRVEAMHLLPGGASKEAWAIETDEGGLLVRRALGGVIHAATLSLEHEFEVLRAAEETGVKVPHPVAYLGELGGREAFAMEFVEGETIGRRIVRDPPAGLETQLADELAKIHAIPPERLPSSVPRTSSRASSTSSTRSATRTRRWSTGSGG